MIIVDYDSRVWGLFEKSGLGESISSVRLDLASYEISNGLEDEIIFIDESILESEVARVKLSRSLCVIVYSENQRDYDLDNIIAVVNGSTNQVVLKNLIQRFDTLSREKQVLKSQLITINSDLSEIMGNVETELLKVKRIYEMKAPKRIQKFSGLRVFSKYCAGDNVGGEFFDVHKCNNRLIVLMSSTDSYLVSSSVLSIFSQMKEEPDFNIESFLSQTLSDFSKINESKTKAVNLDICLFQVDLASLSVEGYLSGDYRFSSSDLSSLEGHKSLRFGTSDLEELKFESSLARGQRYMISSPGFNKNWNQLNPGFIQEELLANTSIKTLDILDEAYFQLKKNAKGSFLSYDASSLVLEVDENVLHEA